MAAPHLQSLVGLAALTAIAWLFSERRSEVRLAAAAGGVAVQLALAALLLYLPASRELFTLLNDLVLALESATRAGTSMVFGYLGGGDLPFDEQQPGGAYVLAFRGLPMVLVVSALSALLFYWRILPRIVGALSWLLQKSLGVGGALGVATAANIFVGMTEAPLLIRPYLARLTRSELFTVMTAGMATVAGTVMALYAAIVGPVIDGALGHILTASLISAPAAITVARLMVPERGPSSTPGTAGEVIPERDADSAMDAVTKGTLSGIQLLANIIAMLIVLVALVHLANLILGLLPDLGGEPFTLQRILGWLMAPVAWLMGIPWREATTAGALLGTKTVLNELIAYLNLAALEPGSLSERSRLILVYAMCGFANFGSLGIMVGGLGTLVPERRGEIVELGMRSIVAGTLATCMTGAVVGLLI
ncbi:NupC/NupG family nucleoside CNT transporter [Endothiovibrio diazotrophicus]